MQHNRPETSDIDCLIDCSRLFSGDISLDVFLRDYWQQKPLLIRDAFPGFTSPLRAEELAGLSCEQDINARIVIEKAAQTPWKVLYGPFDDDTFSQLPQDHWTLLVSDVEKHVAQARQIMDCFRFIPDWRRDDLMFSYAPVGGSVGPHLDAYDVFLLQAEGRRNWKISHTHTNQFLEDTDLSILSSFSADEEWILEPGDMLYLPPGIAHHGIATEDCITCSIGFRAPSLRAMVADYAEHVAREISSGERYTDPGLQRQTFAAEISPQALDSIGQILQSQLVIDDRLVHRWFGQYMTESSAGVHTVEADTPLRNFDELDNLLGQNTFIYQSPLSKFHFIREPDGASLFVDGDAYTVSAQLAETVSLRGQLECPMVRSAAHTEQDRRALVELYNKGCLYFSDETA